MAKSKEEAMELAAEAWNSWRGRYIVPTPAMFREVNPCNECAKIMREELYNSFEYNEEFIRGYQMCLNGSSKSPWPYLHANYKKAKNWPCEYDSAFVFKLRARWCALFPSIIEYRDTISSILKENDRDNILLNNFLSMSNPTLEKLGLPLFGKNDLKGINLGGLELSGPDYAGVQLRNIDLRFSELYSVDLSGAYIYHSNFSWSSGAHCSFTYSIIHNSDFSHSYLPHSIFTASDLRRSSFINTLLNGCNFDGSDLSHVDISEAIFENISIGIHNYTTNGLTRTKKPIFDNIVFNKNTTASFVLDSDIGNCDNKEFVKHIMKSYSKGKKSIFIVHGQDDAAKESVARFLEKLGLNPIILHEQPNKGMTIIEKFESNATKCDYAIVIMTPDDIGFSKISPKNKFSRSRQNVILELGYFFSALKRENVFVLKKGDIEIPSDIFGIVYEPMDEARGWQLRLAQALQHANFDIDMNKAINGK